tara:strand:- start:2 stop:1459 length:1458 start_codon:yes stop_codon:yes gene_type:complete
MYNKIINPITNRKVSITSRCGKLILKKYLQKLYAGNPIASCKKGKEDESLCPDEIYRCNIIDEAGNTKCVDRKGNTLLENLKIEKKLYPNPFQNKLGKIPPMEEEEEKKKDNCNITVSKCPETGYKIGNSEDLSSFQNIRNLIKNLELNDKKRLEINYNGKKYIFNGLINKDLINKDLVNKGLTPTVIEDKGGLGSLKEYYFKTDSKTNYEAITIMEKISSNDHVLDELSIPDEYNKILYEECPNIVPFKIIKNHYFMMKADGTLKGKRFSINVAEKIIMCLVDTLLCLRNRNIYYFDLKSENIGFICINNEMSIFLIDLGSILPITRGRNTGFLSTYPHPIFNSHYLNFKDSSSSNFINIKMLPVCLHIYSYQLSALFFELIGINTGLVWKTINKQVPQFVKSNIYSVIRTKQIFSDEDYQILKKYYDVYQDIDNQLEKFETIFKNLSEMDRLQLMDKPNIITNLSTQLFEEAKEIEPAFFKMN